MPKATPHLRRRRHELDMPTAELAARLGIAEGTLRNAEAGRTPLRYGLFYKAAQVLNIPADVLMDTAPNKHKVA